MTFTKRIYLVLCLSTLLPLTIIAILLTRMGTTIWWNEPVHSSLEAAGALVALVLGALLLAQRQVSGAEQDLGWIAAALFSMGILDAFHGVLPVNASFFWTRGFATFFGGLLFTLVWLPERVAKGRGAALFPWIALGAGGALGAYLDFDPSAMPVQFSADGTFTPAANFLNVVGGIGYLVAAQKFLFARRRAPESENLIFASQCLLLGVAGLLFAASRMWSPVWWLFHFLRFFSYLVVLTYLFVSFRKIQRHIALSNRELKVANQELEAFCYSVSHDLRAPLRGIDGFSQALLEDFEPQLNAEGKQYLSYIREGVQKMARLIDDLLNLSRYTRGEIRRERFDLSAVAREIGTRLHSNAATVREAVRVQDGLMVWGDRNLIQICLENLLGNAWKFTSRQPHPEVEFGAARSKEGEMVYFVRDNGAGFDMAYGKKLFGAFQRLHSESEFPGTGIGLATVRRILHRHGGRVWAESQPGAGATFFFTLPPEPSA